MKNKKNIVLILVIFSTYYMQSNVNNNIPAFLSPLYFILKNPFFAHCTQTLEHNKIIYKMSDHHTDNTSFHGKVYTHTKKLGLKDDVNTALLYRPHVHTYFYGAVGIIVEGDHINHALFFTLTAGDYIALQKGKSPENLNFALIHNSLLGKLTTTEHNVFGITINSVVKIHIAILLPGDNKSTYEILKNNATQKIKNTLSTHINVPFHITSFMITQSHNATVAAFFGNNCNFIEITKELFVE